MIICAGFPALVILLYGFNPVKEKTGGRAQLIHISLNNGFLKPLFSLLTDCPGAYTMSELGEKGLKEMDRRDFFKRVGVGAGALVIGRFAPACIASPNTWLSVGEPIIVDDEQTAFEATLRAHPDWTHYLARAFGGAGPYYYSTSEFGNAPMQAFVNGAPIAQDTLRTRVARGMFVTWEALPGGRLVLPQPISFDEFARVAPGQANAYARIIRRR